MMAPVAEDGAGGEGDEESQREEETKQEEMGTGADGSGGGGGGGAPPTALTDESNESNPGSSTAVDLDAPPESMGRKGTVRTTAWAEILAYLKVQGTEGAEKLKSLFNELDTDHSGGISIDELTVGFKKIGLKLWEEQISEFHKEADTNGDKSLSLDEFITAVTEAKDREETRAESQPTEEPVTSSAVHQFQRPPYELIKGLFADYQELNLQFAYSTLFVVCCPPVALMSYILCYVEIRIDSYKLLFSVRRRSDQGVSSLT